MKKLFKLHAPFMPAGSQPEAIEKLATRRPGKSCLLGVTGSGKTYTLAQVIATQNKPVLILSPNKTLAAQLYEEFSLFFPENKVCYFVSYYDYYQPESYLPAQDVYVPKETKINSEIERLRIEATASLANRKDTIVIASVSAIYSLGDPADYRDLALSLNVGQKISRHELLRQLVHIQYNRNEVAKEPGSIQVLGNTVEVNLPYQKDKLRIELFGDKIDGLEWVSRQNNHVTMTLDNTVIFPAKHFVTPPDRQAGAIRSIKRELKETLKTIDNELYRDRLQKRVAHDIELMQEFGYCPGIENYSSHFDGRLPGQPPFCLFDFFGKDFLLIIDESHIAIPQLHGMHAGDKARKKSLIDFGFRLPSAYDNRPLKFEEIEKHLNDVIFVSATPGDYELRTADQIVEQVIRPTGLVDPEIFVQGRTGQIDHLIEQITETTEKGYRSLVMVLTKRLAEELARHLEEQQIKACYLHSDLKTPQRTELLQKLRMGIFDCLVGVNLLREGIDLPEVALVAIMDADVESFLRDKRSLIQIIGRAARNTEARVQLYADKITKSMRAATDETERRRAIQQAHNEKHGITPKTVERKVKKSITDLQAAIAAASKTGKRTSDRKSAHASATSLESSANIQPLDSTATNAATQSPESITARITALEIQMREAAEELNFERAIELRKEWLRLKG